MSKRSEEIWDEVETQAKQDIAVTTLRQIDALVAVHLFGWQWLELGVG